MESTQNHLDLRELNIPPAPGLDSRRIQIWKSPGWDEADRRNLIVMHDGQNLFREADSHAGIWSVVPALNRLMTFGTVAETAVAGIWNSGKNRWRNYMPLIFPGNDERWNRVKSDSRDDSEIPDSDVYGEWLVGEVIPAILNPDGSRDISLEETGSNYTSIYTMGSSMGGLISLNLLCEYPGVFTGAGCLSTHWTSGKDFTVDYFIPRLPAPGDNRIYFDYGSEGIDADYAPYQERIDRELVNEGWRFGRDFLSHRFPGGEHREFDWRMRVEVPLNFLLNIEI